jgi:Mg-chelatase subunit ChlD
MVTAISSATQLMAASIAKEQVSLTTFSDVSLVDCELTTNYELINQALSLHSAAYVGGRSDLSLGMLSAASTLTNKSKARKWASRVLIVVSDGNTTSALSATAIARELAAQGITIFTVSCSIDSNQSLMAEIAAIGNGKHFHSSSAHDFLLAFREISRSLPTLLTN